MPVFTAKHSIVQIEDASGVYKRVLGPGPGEFGFPELTDDGKDVTNFYDRGDFMGRSAAQDMEGELTITLHHKEEDFDASTFWDAILHRGTWEDAVTCDPGGQVWAPSILVKAQRNGNLFALRWRSARIKVSGSGAVAGNTLSLTAAVVGKPIFGSAALAWPT